MNLQSQQGHGNHITTMTWYIKTLALIVMDTVVEERHGGDGHVHVDSNWLVQRHNPPEDEATRSKTPL